MKIVITGGTGFVGRELVSLLYSEGHSLFVISRIPERQKNTDRLFYIGTDQTAVREVYAGGIDVTIHLATCYGRGTECSSDVYQTNVVFASMVLSEAAKGGCRHFVNTDTYYTSAPALFPHLELYIRSKLDFLDILQKESRLSVINIQLHHVYGENDRNDKFLPWLIRELESADTTIHLSPCEQEIDIVKVDRVACAYSAIINNLESVRLGEVVEVGEGRATRLSIIVELIREVVVKHRPKVPPVKFGGGTLESRQGGGRFLADVSRLLAFGWEPSKDIFKELVGYVEKQLQADNRYTNL